MEFTKPKHNMLRRSFAILLSAAIVLSLLPGVFATEDETLTWTPGESAIFSFQYTLEADQADCVELVVPAGLFDGDVAIDNPAISDAEDAPTLFTEAVMTPTGTENGMDHYQVSVNGAEITAYLDAAQEENTVYTAYELAVSGTVSEAFAPAEGLRLTVGDTQVDFDVVAEEPVAAQAVDASSSGISTYESGNDVTDLMQDFDTWLMQNGVILDAGDTIDTAEAFTLFVTFRVPTVSEDDTDGSYVVPDDYAVFELPDGVVLASTVSFAIKVLDEDTGEELVLGTVTLSNSDSGAIITVTFDGEDAAAILENFIDLIVTFDVTLQYNGTNESDSSGDTLIDILGKEYQIIPPQEESTVTLTKTGSIDAQTGIVDWTLTVTSDTDGALDGYILSDDLDAGINVGDYISGSFDDNGAGGTGGFTGNLLSYTFPDNTVQGTYTFDFQTQLTDAVRFISTSTTSGSATIENTALLTPQNGEAIEDSATLSYTPTWISKSGSYTSSGAVWSDPDKRFVTWSITVNPNGVDFGTSSVTVQDTIPAGLTVDTSASTIVFDGESTQYDLFDSSWYSSKGVSSVVYDTTDNTVTIVFSSLSTKCTITLVTAADDSALYLNGSPSTYRNVVTIDKDDTELGTANASVTPWITSLSKTGSWATNMEAGTIQWQVNYNAGVQAADETEAVIYDLVIPGDSIPAWSTLDAAAQSAFDSEATYNTFVTATYKALNLTLVSGSAQVTTDQNADGTTDTASCSTIEEIPLYNTSAELVAYLVKVTVTEPTHKIVFRYQTQVTDPVLLLDTSTFWNRVLVKVADLYAGANGSIAWNNTFFTKEGLVADDDNESNLPDATVAAKPSAASATDEGAKTVFNYSDQTAIFKLSINVNQLNLTNLGQSSSRGAESKITLTDTLPVGWEITTFADDSTYAVYDASGNLVADLFTSADAAAGNTVYTFTLEGTDIAKLDGATYYIYLKAALSEPEAYFNVNAEYTFTNEATASFTAWDLSLVDTQDVAVTSTVFDKANELKSDGYVLWSIIYNPYGLEKIGDYIVDTLPEGLELEDGTAIAYPITQWNEDGSYVVSTTPIDTPESYISYNVSTRQLTFRFPDSSTGYVLQYVTVVTADANGILTNQAELYYDDSLTEEADDTYTGPVPTPTPLRS